MPKLTIPFTLPDGAVVTPNIIELCRAAKTQYKAIQKSRTYFSGDEAASLEELKAIARELAPLVRLDLPDIHATMTANALYNRFTGEEMDFFTVQTSALFAYFTLVTLAIVEAEGGEA